MILPDFRINTDSGVLTIFSGSYDAGTMRLTLFSGSLIASGSVTPLFSGSIQFDTASKITADILSSEQILQAYERMILGNVSLPADARTTVKHFLETDASGSLIPLTPSSTEYYNRNIRGLISILLSQPEYVLLRGIDLSTAIDPNSQNFLANQNSKLIFVELYGGDDYLSSVIPKDEYDTYVNYRTGSGGSIALSGSSLVDIGDYYMNSALANGSG